MGSLIVVAVPLFIGFWVSQRDVTERALKEFLLANPIPGKEFRSIMQKATKDAATK